MRSYMLNLIYSRYYLIKSSEVIIHIYNDSNISPTILSINNNQLDEYMKSADYILYCIRKCSNLLSYAI